MNSSMRLMKCPRLPVAILLLLVLLLPQPSLAKVSSKGQRIAQGAFTYYYNDEDVSPTSSSVCNSVLFLGVGTAMSTTEYSNLSTLTVEKNEGMVVVIVDANPGGIIKLDPIKFANLINELTANLGQYVHICSNASPLVLVGGHSASGQGAVEALSMLQPQPAGFIGLAPFKLTDKIKISIPSLIWDSSDPSCWVTPSGAGLMAYTVSDDTHRVFFRIPSIKSTR